MLGIDTIKELWGREVENVEAEIASWDSVASEYLLEEKNNFTQDPFLKFMDEKVRLCKDMQVLFSIRRLLLISTLKKKQKRSLI